jgi:hypothetical protein
MNYFTDDNTDGYSTADLAELNDALERRAGDLDPEGAHYDDELQHIGEQVLTEYDGRAAVPWNDAARGLCDDIRRRAGVRSMS